MPRRPRASSHLLTDDTGPGPAYQWLRGRFLSVGPAELMPMVDAPMVDLTASTIRTLRRRGLGDAEIRQALAGAAKVTLQAWGKDTWNTESFAARAQRLADILMKEGD